MTVVKVNGGWVLRTYLVSPSTAAYEDSAVDSFGACMGRAQRELARAGR